jgi:hypothetical protein
LQVRGHSWHPARPGKVVPLSTHKGGTEPKAGPKAILPERDELIG